uniref:Uncharacterized protein n=1 Tax=Dicentrarchus labrax TaxID=13489 RepID=A0A8P4KSV7_DICLA
CFKVEGDVMNKLLQMGSFKRTTLSDYQALCKEYAGSSDSAQLDTFSAYLWFSQLLWFLISFHTHSAQRSRGKTMMVPCDTEYPAFVSEHGCVRYFFNSSLCVKCDKLKFQKDIKKPESWKLHMYHIALTAALLRLIAATISR